MGRSFGESIKTSFTKQKIGNLAIGVLVFEAKTKEGVEKIQKIFHEKMDKYPEIGKEWKSG